MIWRYLQLLIWWMSFLIFPAEVYLIWSVINGGAWWFVGLALLGLLFIYSRFVEPNLLKVRWEKFDFKKGEFPLRVILISDLHLGVFKGVKFLNKVLKMVVDLRPDLVVIPGDLINDPSAKELAEFFKPLGVLKCPVLVVTGNHDARKPGMYESKRVRQAARGAGLVTIDNGKYLFEKNGYELEVFGLSDLMEGQIDYDVLKDAGKNRANLILAHNPDTAHFLEESLSEQFPLILSGHTHAGQIQIPFLYKLVIPSKYNFVNGWYEVKGKKVFVSSGLGEVILPMRFGVIPEIVVMDLKV